MIDWLALAIGFGLGSVASGVFFAGLALGMRVALRSGRPAPVLMLSAALRIALLLSAGWAVADLGAVAVGGFALAFLLLRFAAVRWARGPIGQERS